MGFFEQIALGITMVFAAKTYLKVREILEEIKKKGGQNG